MAYKGDSCLRTLRFEFMLHGNNGLMAELILGLNLIACTEGNNPHKVKRAGISKKGNLYVNIDWLNTEGREYDLFLFYHEIGHLLGNHAGRRGNKNHKIWNNACDTVINLQALIEGYEVYDWVFRDPKYSKWTAEEVYEDMVANKGGTEPEEEWHDTEIIDDGDAGVTDVATPLERMIRDAVVKHVKEARALMNPEDIEVLLQKFVEPKADWRSLLLKVTGAGKNLGKLTMHKPKTNMFLASGMVKRRRRKHSYGDIAIAVDFSYSMYANYEKALAEVYGMMRRFEPDKVFLMLFDTQVNQCIELKSTDTLDKLVCNGGGGTDLYPVVEYVSQKLPMTKTLVIISDFEAHPLKEVTPFNLVMLKYGDYNYVPLHGDVIQLPN